MDLRLRDAVALVTGASAGMGRASALALAAEGARVVIVARNPEPLAATAHEARWAGASQVHTVVADLTDPDAAGAVVDETVEAFGGIDVLVNTVGVCEVERGGILAQDDGYWQRAFESVLLVDVRLCRLVVPHLRERGGGAIVNISAMSARHYLPVMAHYSAMKAALAHFTKNLAREFAADHIRANAVMPGMIESEAVAAAHEQRREERGWSDEDVFRDAVERYPLVTFADRFGQPDEVGDLVAFLASPRASYINGALVNIDGGSIF